MIPLDQWTPRPRPRPPVLRGARVRLELLDWSDHCAGLFACLGGEANAPIWRFMPMGPFLTEEALEAGFETARVQDDWETLVIRRAGDGHVLGMASYMRIRPAHGGVEVGCVAFGYDLQRTPEATEAIYLMARHVFEDLGYRRFEWKCDNANEPSKRAAVRFGFQYEGLFRQDMVRKGVNRDTAWYSMIDSEWPALKAAFDAWLEPGNFDAAGQQKRRLEDFRQG